MSNAALKIEVEEVEVKEEKKKNQAIPEKFQFEPTSGLYAIKHKPTNSLYIGVTTDLRRRMRNHISKLRKGNHPNLAMQALFHTDPNLDNWNAKILMENKNNEMTKEELHDFETELAYRVQVELPKYILLCAYKNKTSQSETLNKIKQRLIEM